MLTRGRVAAGALLVLVGGWLAAGVLTSWRAAGDARAGARLAARAKHSVSVGGVLAGRPLPDLARAQRAFAAAHDRLGGPAVTPLRWTPVLGRQLRAVRAMAKAGAGAAAATRQAILDSRALVRATPPAGPARVAFVERAAAIARQASQRFDQLDPGPDRALVGPVARRRRQLVEELTADRARLRDATTTATALADLLRGPRHYLLLAANNAEMRAGSGMFLSAGTLDLAGGQVHLGPMTPTADLPPAGGVTLGGDAQTLWAWTDPTREWRNLGMSPRFDQTAPVAARMWQATHGEPVDGVLAVDVAALQAVLAGTGPVSVAGRTVAADSVVPFLLTEQYAGISAADRGNPAQVARREQLGAIAAAAVDGLQGPALRVEPMAVGLAKAAGGRHVLAWSARPGEQAAWHAAGLDGSLRPLSLMVAVLNRGGNKLDPFLTVTSRIARSGRTVHLTVDLTNTAPAGLPSYVEGPTPGSNVGAGDYVGLLAITLPGPSTGVRVAGDVPVVVGGPDGPTRVLAVQIVLHRGESVRRQVTFRVPAGSDVRVEPSGRLPPGEWRQGRARWNDGVARMVTA